MSKHRSIIDTTSVGETKDNDVKSIYYSLLRLMYCNAM